MAKKDIKFEPPVEEKMDETFETEAYGNPEPDKGMDTTVMKPVGMGAPVPVVMPKHNTVQLQPIIVPLAVVPYMTQDSDVLRTDGESAGQYQSRQAASEFENAGTAKREKVARQKKESTGKRIVAFVEFLFAAVVVSAIILAKYCPELGLLKLGDMNIIDSIANWISTGIAPENMLFIILYSVMALFGGITFIISLISLICGRLPSRFIVLTSLLYAAPVVAVLCIRLVQNTFVLDDEIALIVLASSSVLSFILSIIFSVVLNRESYDKSPKKASFDYNNEI